MDNRFQGADTVENGGMFSRDKINQITQYPSPYLDSWCPSTAPTASCDRRIWPDA